MQTLDEMIDKEKHRILEIKTDLDEILDSINLLKSRPESKQRNDMLKSFNDLLEQYSKVFIVSESTMKSIDALRKEIPEYQA